MDQKLLQDLSTWKDGFVNEVLSLYKSGNQERGRLAFDAWKRRFEAYLRQELPDEYPVYQSTVNYLKLLVGVRFGEHPFDAFMRGDGDRCLAYLDHLIQEVHIGRLARPDPSAAAASASARPGMALPSGTVTFLFTDIEGSVVLWEHHPEKMAAVIERHNQIMRECIEGHGGSVVKFLGDGCHAVFQAAPDALAAAVDAHRKLHFEDWSALIPTLDAVPVRMALNTETATVQDNDYVGTSVNRAARLMATASGGQILLPLITQQLVRESLPDGVDLLDRGEHIVRDVSIPIHVYQVIVSEVPTVHRPLATAGKPSHLSVYTEWGTDPNPGKDGYSLVLKNVGSATVKALKIQGELQPPLFGFAKPTAGWYNNTTGIHQMTATLEPPDLHPGESRIIARIRPFPKGPVEAEGLRVKLTIFCEDHKPLEVELELPAARYGSSEAAAP